MGVPYATRERTSVQTSLFRYMRVLRVRRWWRVEHDSSTIIRVEDIPIGGMGGVVWLTVKKRRGGREGRSKFSTCL